MANQDKEWQTLLSNAENALDQKEIQPPQSGKAIVMRRMTEREIWEMASKGKSPS